METRKRNSRLEGSFISTFKDFIKYFQVRKIQKKFSEESLKIIDVGVSEDKYNFALCSNYLTSGNCLNKILQDASGNKMPNLSCDYRKDQIECPNYDNTQILSLLNKNPYYFENTDKIFN